MSLPADLSGESTKKLREIYDRIGKELESRGGFEGAVYTFIKKKEGKLLNKEDKWVSNGKVVSLFEFKGEDKKMKDFMVSSKCRGAKEPVEDKESKYGDQHKYRLQFDPDDDMTIIGCYME